MTDRKLLTVAFLLLVAGLVGLYFTYNGAPSSFPFFNVCEEAKAYASKIKVVIVDEGTTVVCSLDNPNVKVLHYHEGGYQLSIQRRETAWQLVLGVEDWQYQGSGDYADVIIKITKFKDGSVDFEVACLGGFQKKIYYKGDLKLDTGTGQRYAWWSVPAS